MAHDHWPLPTEITLEILQLLSYHDIWSVSRSSRTVYAAAKSRVLFSAVRLGSQGAIRAITKGGGRTVEFTEPKAEQHDTKRIRERWKAHLSQRKSLQKDVEFIRTAGIGELIKEAWVVVRADAVDEGSLKQALQMVPALKSMHVFGGAAPDGGLRASSAMKDMKKLCRQLQTLEFSWCWGASNRILDVSSEGPRNLRKLKIDLYVGTESALYVPHGMVPRIVRRAGMSSLETLTELDLRYFVLSDCTMSKCQVDLELFKGAPLRRLRYTARAVAYDYDTLRTICSLFPDLEELVLSECWRFAIWTEDMLPHLSRLTKCKSLTLPYELLFAQMSSFSNVQEADNFRSQLPTYPRPEHKARRLTLRVGPTRAIVDAMPELKRMHWVVDPGAVPEAGSYYSSDHVADIGEGSNGRKELRWQRQDWWADVKVERIGPDHNGVECQGIWKQVVASRAT